MVFVIYLLLCVVSSAVLASIGYDVSTWQWWVCCGCVWAAYQLGRIYEKIY